MTARAEVSGRESRPWRSEIASHTQLRLSGAVTCESLPTAQAGDSAARKIEALHNFEALTNASRVSEVSI